MDTTRLSDAQILEIEDERTRSSLTSRPCVPALEAMMFTPIPVLDKGFIRVVDYMGDDSSVVQAARVSYGRGTRKPSEDAALIRYLMRHRHSTPFEMCEIKYHCKLPIFIARQWIRHRTANVNEYSARYSVLDKEFYIPEPAQLAAQASTNRQGRGDVLDAEQAAKVLHILRTDAERCYAGYETLLGEENDPSSIGLARELARMNLTLNTYTQWYWKIDLHNLFGFLSLRAEAHAQYEIRAYAEAILRTVEAWVPHSHKAFLDYRLGAHTLSAQGVAAVSRMLKGEAVTMAESGMSRREWDELRATFGLGGQ